MSKMLSVIALSGDKAAALAAAADEVRVNAVQVILHGNRRNFADTAEALRAAGACTKGGTYAQSGKGDTLAALASAEAAALSAQSAIRPIMKGKADAMQTARANEAAQGIADAFEVAVTAAREARKIARSTKASTKGEGDGKAAPTAETMGEAVPTAETMGEAVPTADNDAPAKLRAMIAALADERDALAAQLESVTAERNALAAQLEALRAVQAMPTEPKRAKRAKGEAMPIAA